MPTNRDIGDPIGPRVNRFYPIPQQANAEVNTYQHSVPFASSRSVLALDDWNSRASEPGAGHIPVEVFPGRGRYRVTALLGLHVRRLPFVTSRDLGVLPIETIVQVEGVRPDGWYKVSSPIEGWMCGNCPENPNGPWLVRNNLMPLQVGQIEQGRTMPLNVGQVSRLYAVPQNAPSYSAYSVNRFLDPSYLPPPPTPPSDAALPPLDAALQEAARRAAEQAAGGGGAVPQNRPRDQGYTGPGTYLVVAPGGLRTAIADPRSSTGTSPVANTPAGTLIEVQADADRYIDSGWLPVISPLVPGLALVEAPGGVGLVRQSGLLQGLDRGRGYRYRPVAPPVIRGIGQVSTATPFAASRPNYHANAYGGVTYSVDPIAVPFGSPGSVPYADNTKPISAVLRGGLARTTYLMNYDFCLYNTPSLSANKLICAPKGTLANEIVETNIPGALNWKRETASDEIGVWRIAEFNGVTGWVPPPSVMAPADPSVIVQTGQDPGVALVPPNGGIFGPLGFKSRRIGGHKTRTVVARTEAAGFQPQTLFIPRRVAKHFEILEISAGGICLLGGSGCVGIPAELYSNQGCAGPAFLQLPLIVPGQPVRIRVKNISGSSKRFRAALNGLFFY